jgi:chromosome segregation ATPase
MEKHKQIIVASFLIVILAMVIALFFYTKASEEMDKVYSLKPKIESVTAQRADIIKNIELLNNRRSELVIQLQDYSERIQNIGADIPALKAEKEDIEALLTEAEKAASGINDLLDTALVREAGLRDDLAKAEASHRDLLEALEYAGKEKSEFEEQLKDYIKKSQGVQLGKIVVKVARPVEGSIVEVSKKYNFSVIDLGKEAGVRSGDLLEIYRGGKLIAKALIENVYDDMSSIIIFDQ